ncbi:MAG: hypothetical protein M3435_05275 [Actinomycetota bacterium]|nr:hypothetical protein [Actinomycetota bacterium]
MQFFILARYEHKAETSWRGVALTIASAALMPAFGIPKRRVGAKLGSAATKAEGNPFAVG